MDEYLDQSLVIEIKALLWIITVMAVLLVAASAIGIVHIEKYKQAQRDAEYWKHSYNTLAPTCHDVSFIGGKGQM